MEGIAADIVLWVYGTGEHQGLGMLTVWLSFASIYKETLRKCLKFPPPAGLKTCMNSYQFKETILNSVWLTGSNLTQFKETPLNSMGLNWYKFIPV